jgi:hypothetical protein
MEMAAKFPMTPWRSLVVARPFGRGNLFVSAKGIKKALLVDFFPGICTIFLPGLFFKGKGQN